MKKVFKRNLFLGIEKSENGYTLIELLLIIIILGVLVGIGFLRYGQVQENANIKADKADLRVLNTSIQIFSVKNNTTTNDLGDPYHVSNNNINSVDHPLVEILNISFEVNGDWPRSNKYSSFKWDADEGTFSLVFANE